MMISPETFYKNELQGKNAEEIMTIIRGLKREIGRLKNIVEHPDYICTTHPSERVRIYCTRDYLEWAKQALEDIGGTYVPSVAEQKAIDFNADIPYINKIEFSIGGYFGGYQTRTYTIKDDKVHIDIEHSLILKPSNLENCEIEKIDTKYFLDELKSIHIGEWRRNYNLRRFGYTVCDGTHWDLAIYFSNGRKHVKIYGDNAYPYNFDKLLELFEIEE